MRILAISNLHDIFYEELEEILMKEINNYDLITLLDNIDLNILHSINKIFKLNNINKQIFINNNSYNEFLDISLRNNIISGNELVDGIKLIELNSSNRNLNIKDYTNNLLVSNFNPNELSNKETVNLFVNSNLDKKISIWIYGENRYNTINIIEDIYTIGISGISIIDTNKSELFKLY